MDIKLYEYLLTTKDLKFKELGKEIEEFTNQLIATDNLYVQNADYTYYLLKPIVDDRLCLVHYVQSSKLKTDNYRFEKEDELEYIDENDLESLREVKHVFIAVDKLNHKIYMNHAFSNLEKAKLFLAHNSSVFEKKLELVQSFDENKIEETVSYIKSLSFKQVPEEVMLNMIGDGIIFDISREDSTKTAELKIRFKKKKKVFDAIIRKLFGLSIEKRNDLLIEYKDNNDRDCAINTRKLIKSIWCGKYKLSNEDEEEEVRKMLFSFIKDLV